MDLTMRNWSLFFGYFLPLLYSFQKIEKIDLRFIQEKIKNLFEVPNIKKNHMLSQLPFEYIRFGKKYNEKG